MITAVGVLKKMFKIETCHSEPEMWHQNSHLWHAFSHHNIYYSEDSKI